ncbi:MAG: DUF1501 domain-containing protein [Planctomycetaceae bacterium]
MRDRRACGSAAHFSRRGFLQTGVGAMGAVGFTGMTAASGAEALAGQQKQVVVFFLAGGVSQLETWDPKPGTDTGGPFLTIPTSVPGTHFCELLPYTAQQAHHLAVIRGVNTAEDDHGKGAYIMQYGHRETPGFQYPSLGSAFAQQLTAPSNPLPGYLTINGGGATSEPSFLGPQFAPINLSGTNPPANLKLPDGLAEEHDRRRRELRAKLSGRFVQGRAKAETEAYNGSFEQTAQLLAKKDVFDFTKITEADKERYGKGEFAQHCLMARQLVESGVTFTKVTHTNYDTHSENFNFHIEQLGEFDRPFAMFIQDLAERGRLANTLVIVMSEFGRTPRINHLVGRDHWSKAWSVVVAGCGIKGGAVVGKTNENGTAVIDREVNGGHLFHTYYKAVGLDSSKAFWHEGRPFNKADPKTEAISEVLA